jgi:hypothetical protein
MGASPSLARYRDRAERVVNDIFDITNDPIPDVRRRELTVEIQLAIHEFVAHDMEWAALAVESVMTNRSLDDFDIGVALVGVVASIRARGR